MRNKPEQQFQQAIIDLARLSGFEHIYHTWDSRNSPAGFPDLIMLKGKRMIIAEIKVGAPLSAEQYFWLLAFLKITDEVYLWTPEDWEEIEQILRSDKEGES